MNVCDQYVGCNECQHEMPVREAFDRASRSWPFQGWIWFKCPECGGGNHLLVRDEAVIEGYLDGVPEPSFVQKRRINAGDLRVTLQSDGIKLRALNLQWVIPST